LFCQWRAEQTPRTSLSSTHRVIATSATVPSPLGSVHHTGRAPSSPPTPPHHPSSVVCADNHSLSVRHQVITYRNGVMAPVVLSRYHPLHHLGALGARLLRDHALAHVQAAHVQLLHHSCTCRRRTCSCYITRARAAVTSLAHVQLLHHWQACPLGVRSVQHRALSQVHTESLQCSLGYLKAAVRVGLAVVTTARTGGSCPGFGCEKRPC